MASVSSSSSSGSEDESNDKQAASTSGSSNPFANMIDPDFDMSKVPETEDIRIEQYFSKEELAELSKIEMTRYRNMKRNYDVMRMLGLPGKKPYFMERNRRSLVQPKEPPTPPLTSSEEEEDEEWTPELERKKNQRPKKPWFLLPPKKPRMSKPKPKTTGPQKNSKVKKKAEATVSKAPSDDDVAKTFLGFQAEEVAEIRAATAAGLAELEKKMKALELEIQEEEAAGPQDGQEEGSESDISTDLEEELLTTTLQPPKLQELKEPEPVVDREETQRSRYPKRNIPRKNYKEVELPDDDHYLFCEDCNELYEGDCPVHGPLTVVKDKVVPKGEPNRAVHTLPDYLSVCPSKIKGAGDGVWLDGQAMPKNLVFGPYDGKITGPEIGLTSGYAWQISKNDKVKYYIDATDVTKSSWMRYVNCARNEEEQNLVAFQYYRNIYYRTYKTIPPGTELLVWYGNEYAKELGISEKEETEGEEPNKQKQSIQVSRQVQLQATGVGGIQTGAVAGYGCSRCGKLFSTQDYLDRHVKTHADMSGSKRFKCQHCNYSTDKTDHLKIHMMTHTGERPFKCLTCGKGFTQKSHLRPHQRVHTGEKPYRCEECGRSFNVQANLTKHMLTHTGLKHHVCTECGKGFTRTDCLQAHMRIHTGEKPFKCEHCDMRFTKRGSLKGHVICIHTKELPHKCQVCHKGYTKPNQLRTHLQEVHSN
ncbi:PREDICTED: histone-lysine N-methyltransferase PRDM9-like [Branchiostoma belcheri]|uniref:Histone-lysine N-methyltransferase PRDM9-like n=1 Tax=Branchiostoma belcheri TaxID=7741 RepID=A0A6P4ZYY5_BRABE|nr:PREDICTED: histone-lysine N-methyltransferase PRDM9-like [Branchiostoma belcheri]